MRERIFCKRNLILVFLLVGLLVVGTYQYDRLILAPAQSAWPKVQLGDLLAERWYETDHGKSLTEDLSQVTDSGAIKLATGLYYREYKRRYSPGISKTQYVRVGPDQYPLIYSMVTDACRALGSIDGEPIPTPSVYVGWTGKRSFEVTNFTKPSIVIGNDFLWAFKPEELRYLIARQIGHIHCKHIYLLDVTKGVRSLLDSALPDFLAKALIGGLGGNLLDWNNEAQMSADRAGLLTVGDVDVACSALIKLNILASIDDFYGQPNPEAFAAQAAATGEDRFTTASAALAELMNPNPFLTTRVSNLLNFYNANSTLFKDRTNFPGPKGSFDPGIMEDSEILSGVDSGNRKNGDSK